MADEKLEKRFEAKKVIPAATVAVKSGRIIFTPERDDDNATATLSVGIPGVPPIALTKEEADFFMKWARAIAGRASNLTEIKAVTHDDSIIKPKEPVEGEEG